MIPNLAHQRCSNHADREAVARCPECARFYCRECVTEHDDRVLCAACLKKTARLPVTQRPGFIRVLRIGQCIAGIVVTWFFFFLVAEKLIALPSEFHEGTLWKVHWLDEN